MLELYHNAISTCSQKVRLALAEKGLDYASHEIDLLSGGQHDPAYVKLNPNHVVPTLVHEGRVLIESSLIDEYLDDAFPEPPLRPQDPAARHAMRLWTRWIDERVAPVAAVVTFAIGPRAALLQQPEAVREANIAAMPDPAKRAIRRSVLEHGVKAPEFAGALARMVELLDRMEASLEPGGWLSGGLYGQADICALPYVLRLDHLAMSPLLAAGARPRVADWYARVQARPSFESAVAKWAPAPILALFHSQGEKVWPEVEPLTRAG